VSCEVVDLALYPSAFPYYLDFFVLRTQDLSTLLSLLSLAD